MVVTPNTAHGLDNFRMVFGTCSTSGADTLESVVSIGDVAPGADRGTGNLLMGFWGRFTRTFAYWRRVMNAAFHLIAEMRQTIALLYEKLCASDAHIIDLEAQNQTLEEQLKMKTAECESQNRTHVEQLKMKDAQCEQHAQRCWLAEHTTKLTNLEATRRLAGQAVEHTRLLLGVTLSSLLSRFL
jgi:hypothetical protein